MLPKVPEFEAGLELKLNGPGVWRSQFETMFSPTKNSVESLSVTAGNFQLHDWEEEGQFTTNRTLAEFIWTSLFLTFKDLLQLIEK